MKALRIALLTLIAVLLVGGGAAALGGYYVYAQVKQEVKPVIAQESLADYSANIVNSVLNDRALEIPAEILSTIVTQQSGREIACLVGDDNLLQLWITQELPYVGKTDICFSLALQDFDNRTGKLTFLIDKISLGRFAVPDFLEQPVLQLTQQFNGENVHISGNTAQFTIDPFQADFMNNTLAVRVNSVTIENGKLYFSLRAERMG